MTSALELREVNSNMLSQCSGNHDNHTTLLLMLHLTHDALYNAHIVLQCKASLCAF